MLKRRILIALVAMAMLVASVGCGSKKTETDTQNSSKTEVSIESEGAEKTQEVETAEDNTDDGQVELPNKMEFKEQGMTYEMPELFMGDKMNFDALGMGPSQDGLGGMIFNYAPQAAIDEIMAIMNEVNENGGETDMTEEEQMAVMTKFYESEIPFMQIQAYTKDFLKTNKIADITQLPNNDLLGEQDGYEYYISYNNEEAGKNLPEADQKLFKEGLNTVESIKASFELIPIYDEMAEIKGVSKFPEFTTKDLNGNEVTDKIFADSKLTMVNVWATTCGPCVSEMPELEEIYKERKDAGFNLIGIVTDGETALEDAKFILDKKGVNFANIIMEKSLEEGFVSKISGTPTTVFVNSKGEIVGEPILGGREKSVYDAAIDEVFPK